MCSWMQKEEKKSLQVKHLVELLPHRLSGSIQHLLTSSFSRGGQESKFLRPLKQQMMFFLGGKSPRCKVTVHYVVKAGIIRGPKTPRRAEPNSIFSKYSHIPQNPEWTEVRPFGPPEPRSPSPPALRTPGPPALRSSSWAETLQGLRSSELQVDTWHHADWLTRLRLLRHYWDLNVPIRSLQQWMYFFFKIISKM